MQETLTLLRMRYHVVTTRIGFLGASLGALDGAYLSVIDARERKVGIDTYLLLNPPLDLTYALERVDEWNARGARSVEPGPRHSWRGRSRSSMRSRRRAATTPWCLTG
jgi:hypothetical protein